MDADDDFPAFFRGQFAQLVVYLQARGFMRYAEDAAHQAMAEAYACWDRIENPLAWVRVAGVRIAGRALLRDQQRGLRDAGYLRLVMSQSIETPDAAAELAEEQLLVLETIKAMPKIRGTVVALAFDGYTVRQIAGELRIAETTVRSHLRHARQALRREIKTGGVA